MIVNVTIQGCRQIVDAINEIKTMMGSVIRMDTIEFQNAQLVANRAKQFLSVSDLVDCTTFGVDLNLMTCVNTTIRKRDDIIDKICQIAKHLDQTEPFNMSPRDRVASILKNLETYDIFDKPEFTKYKECVRLHLKTTLEVLES